MDLAIAFLVVFAIGFGVGYAVRERKSRNPAAVTTAIFEPLTSALCLYGLACAFS